MSCFAKDEESAPLGYIGSGATRGRVYPIPPDLAEARVSPNGVDEDERRRVRE
jgi:hypothetical protein